MLMNTPLRAARGRLLVGAVLVRTTVCSVQVDLPPQRNASGGVRFPPLCQLTGSLMALLALYCCTGQLLGLPTPTAAGGGHRWPVTCTAASSGGPPGQPLCFQVTSKPGAHITSHAGPPCNQHKTRDGLAPRGLHAVKSDCGYSSKCRPQA